MRREAALPALDDAPPIELVRDGRVSRTVSLSAVSEVRVSNVDKKSEPGELPVRLCNYTDVYKNDYITDDLEFMRATASRAEIARFGLRIGDVVITKDSETPDDIGIPSLVDEAAADLVCGYHLAMIRPSPDKVDPTFLAKQLAQPRIAQYYGQQANGSTRYGLPMAAIERTPIWMPELAQQRGIGLLARQLDAAIERSSALIAKLKLARAGLLDDLLTFGLDNFGQLREPDRLRPTKIGLRPVTWKVGSLGQFVDKAEYGTNLSLSDVADGIPVLRMNNIVDGEFDLSDLRYSAVRTVEKFRVRKDDVLFNRTNSWEHVGKAAIWRNREPGPAFASYLVRLHCTNELSPKFLHLWINWPPVQRSIRTMATPGVQQVNINPTNLRRTSIAVPDTAEEQEAIVDRFEALSREIEDVQCDFRKLRAVRGGLFSDLLSGRTRLPKTIEAGTAS